MKLVNTHYFIEVPKTGYTKAPYKSQEWRDWWKEQGRRCKYGYSVGGVRITGDHYYHLNFKEMPVVDIKTGVTKIMNPYFTDLDYEYFNIIEKCREEKKGFIGLKARRKGFSHKAATLVENRFLFHRDSVSIIGAYTDEYSTEGTMAFVKDSINSLRKKGCAFARNMYPNRSDYIRAAFQDDEGVERGLMSEVYSLTYGNNANAAAGKMIVNGYMIFEEAGEFKNLLKAYGKTEPCWRIGASYSGIPLIFGTGGNIEDSCEDFAEMFYNPHKYNLMAFPNKYSDEQPDIEVGYFCPATKFYIPFIDEHGNSKEEDAKEYILGERAGLENSSDPQALFEHCIAYPISPEQAFLATHPSPFNKQKIMNQIMFMNRKSAQKVIKRGNLEWKDKALREVYFKEDPKGIFNILEFPEKNADSKTYVSGIDPYAQDQSTGVSKGAMYVFKRFMDAEHTYNLPVAEYCDRPDTEDEFLENCFKLACFFKSKMLFEAVNKGWFNWFKVNHNIDYLTREPTVLIKSIVEKHKSTFKFGLGMTTPIKQDMLLKIKDYIQTSCEKIYFIDLLRELLKWNDKGNFDRVMAFGICIMHDLSIFKTDMKDEVAGNTSEFTKYIIHRNGGRISFERV